MGEKKFRAANVQIAASRGLNYFTGPHYSQWIKCGRGQKMPNPVAVGQL